MLKFLIIQTASIGDVILATPVLEKIHNFYPGADIDVLVKKGNEGLFQGHPFLREVLTWDKSRNKYLHLYALLRKIRRERYDHVVNIQRFASSGFLTAFSRAVHTMGFDKNPFSSFFSTKVPHHIGAAAIHETERNLMLVESITDGRRSPVKLYPTPQDYEKVAEYKNSEYICIAPASLWFTKQYPVEKWIDLVNKVPKKFRIYCLGSQNDVEICTTIVQRSNQDGISSLAGGLTLLETAALMQDAVMNYVNDSAPQHLASAVNAPVTAIFCSTIPEFGFGPLSDDAVVVETDQVLDCKPCGLHGLRECPEGHFKCALTIDTNKLLGRLP